MWWILPYLAWVSPVALLWWFVLADNDRPRSRSSPYSQPAWYFAVKRLWALVAVRRMKAARAEQAAQPTEGMSHENFFLPTEYERHLEEPRSQLKEGIVDSLSFHGADFKSNSLVVRMTRMRNCLARLVLQLKVGDSVFELPHMPDTLASNTGAAWTAGGDWGGLRIEVVEPLRRWRIAFNGVLREGQPRSATDWDGLPGDQARLRHVRFNFLWHACSGPYNCRDDWSASLLADTLAREPWQSWPNSSWMDIIEEHVDGYDQYGILHGEVKVEGGEPQEVYLRGLRQRRCGPDEALSLHRKITISGVVENGVMFSVGATCHPGHLSHATYGHIRLPDGQLVSIDSTSLSLEALAEDRDHIPKHFVLLFTAGGVRYTSALHVPQEGGLAVLSGRPWSWLTELRPSQCSLEWADRGVLEGVGVVELGCRYDGPCPLPLTAPAPLLREVKVTRGALVLALTDDACRSSPLVGGKGSSLAALTALLAAGDGDHDALYSVPAGFCLTVTSLERQLAAHPALRRAVDDLAAAAASSTAPMDAALAAKCEAVVALFAATPICEEVAGQVRAALQRLEAEADAAAFTQRESSWAVRSSAVGEDSDELSAAGQNETFLGCRGADGVLDGVRRCWASLFALQSVQYRRQYAQPVDAPMAVVVQRMVQAHCAGVLFTCDPASGDPRRMLITANYGLGESVVSAAVDPDVLVVRRDMAGQMHVEEKRSGGKQHRIVLSEHGGVREEAVADASAVCLSDGEALRLGRAGAMLERAFGGARDVEWAFADGRLHLLQSRPVTALFNWTEFELLHEMDSPSPSDEDVFTTANASEVLPGASSPLCESTTGRGYEMSTRGAMDGKAKYYFKNGCAITHHHLTINVLALLLRNVGPTLDTSCQVRDLALCGHSFTTPRMHRAALKRNGCSQQDAFTKLKSMMQSALLARRGPEWVRIAQAMQAALDVHELAAAETTSRSVLKRIAEALPKLLPIFGMHNLTSAASSFSQVIAMNVLAEGAKELSNEHITDVAVMLTCTGGDVTSAGIPTAMKEIAAAVRRCPNWKDFVEVAPEDGIAWLQNHCTDAHTKTLNFLKKYGNRVVREFDVATVTWEEQPDRMMATLQPLVASGSHEAPNPAVPTSLEDTINKLKSPKRSSTRFILRYLLPWFQRCVVHREFTKEAAVRAIHKFRLAFRRLGLLLEKEGRLPDRTLANFLTFWELYRLAYEQPDPSIVDKARRRKRFWPEWDALVFAEALHGPPKPLRFDSVSEASPGSVVAQGTPASESSVTARACVVLTLEGPEIKELRAGDVLITHATDVGWSPFFPMLGGVVTEMGGLISHGAVVAREYGLPCLVGVQGATRMFKTGDMVRIDGKTGKVSKIE